MKIDCSVLILAAGLSSRMGSPKQLLLSENKMSFLENIANTYSEFGCRNVVIVVSNKKDSQINYLQLPDTKAIVVNNKPESGRFNSIMMGLAKVETEYVFIQNIDNPLIQISTLQTIYENRVDCDIVKPSYHGVNGHPILISKKVIKDILNESNAEIKLNEYIKKYNTKNIAVADDSILININTQEDYQKYFGKK